MSRTRLGIRTGLGLGALGYLGVVNLSRRILVQPAPLPELEAALDNWLAEAGLRASHHYVATPAGRVHVLEAGGGPETLVVLAGLHSTTADFAELLVRLAQRYRVLGVDLPGTGLSDPIRFRGHPREEWNRVLEAVAREFDLAEFSLVGHSLGGLAAGGFAISWPGRVRRLVLISPLGLSRRIPWSWNLALVPGLMDLRATYERVRLRGRGASSADSRADARPPSFASARESYRRLAGRRRGRGSDLDLPPRLFRPLGLRAASQLLPALGLLSGRTLVIWGTEDRRLPLKEARPGIRSFPGVRLEEVPEVGHLLPVQRPELVARLIAEFAS